MLDEFAGLQRLRRRNLKPLRSFSKHFVKRLNGLNPDLYRLPFGFALDMDQHVLSRFELLTGQGERVGKDHGLELPRGIGKSREREAVTRLRLPVLLISDGRGKPRFRPAMRLNASREVGPAHDVEAAELFCKVIERV